MKVNLDLAALGLLLMFFGIGLTFSFGWGLITVGIISVLMAVIFN